MSTKQLYEKTSEGMKEVNPLVAIEDIYSKLSDTPLEALVSLYNHVKCEWKGSVADTRRTVPLFLRRSGLFITYNNGTKYITEFFSAGIDQITTEGWVKDSNWISVPDEDYISTGVKPGVGSIGYEQLNDKLKQLFKEKVNVTNYPDDEDIVSVDNMLKLKDREADAANFQSKSYIILRKNLSLVNGVVKNILTQNMINKPNTIYEIRYDFDLNGETIKFPDNIILKFNGGCIFNGKIRGYVLTQNDLIIDNFKNPKSNDDTEALQLFIDACCNVNITRSIYVNNTIYLRSSTNLIGSSRRYAFIVWNTMLEDFALKVGTEDSPYVIEKLDSAYWSDCNIEHLRLAYKSALYVISNNYNDFAPKCLLFNNNGVINDVSFFNFKINLQRDKYIDNLIIRNVFFSIGNERRLNYNPAVDFNVILLGPCGDNVIIENAGYANIKCKNINNLSITNGIQIGLYVENCYLNIQNLHNENTDMFPLVSNYSTISIFNSFFMLKANDAFNFSNFSSVKIENCEFVNHPYLKEYFYLSPNCIKTKYSTIKLYNNILGFGSPIKVNDTYVDNCTIINNNIIPNNQQWSNYLNIEIKTVKLSSYFDNSNLDVPITGNFDGTTVTYDVYTYLNFKRRILINTKTVTLNPTENQIVEINIQAFNNVHLDVILVRTFKGKKQYYNLKKIYNRTIYVDNNYIYYTDNNDDVIDIESPNIIIDVNKINHFQNNNYTVSVDKLQNKDTDLVNNNLKLGDTILLYNYTKFLGKMTKYENMYNDSFAKLTDLNIKLDSSNLHFITNLSDTTKINKGEDIKYYGGKFTDICGIDINKRFGDINNVPVNVRKGQMYYLNDNKPIFYNGTNWLDSNGNPATVQTEGSTNDRPSNVKLGFIYKDTTLNKLIIWEGTKWVNLDGTELAQ